MKKTVLDEEEKDIIDTHGHARGTLTEYKLRLTGSAGLPTLRSG